MISKYEMMKEELETVVFERMSCITCVNEKLSLSSLECKGCKMGYLHKRPTGWIRKG